jgi:hypothetical protein
LSGLQPKKSSTRFHEDPKLKRTAQFNEFVETTVPPKWRDRFNKSEKGVDIEMCCDALKLASASKLDRLFFLTNDDDFLRLCRALKEFGSNISIIHLTDVITPNISLLQETDSYDVVPIDDLKEMFVLPIVKTEDATPPAKSDEVEHPKATAPSTDAASDDEKVTT